jgi:4-hydroxy-tetrahydrodipicolinate reductase
VERPGLNLVGGIDVDPDKVGIDVGWAVGLQRTLGFSVVETLSDALASTDADVALHTTNSYFDLFEPQIIEILEAGLDIVSTSEELSFPWLSHSKKAAEIDTLAKRVGKTVLATGINPGFLMDALPLSLTAICQRVDHIAVTRGINASTRRGPFQIKIGCGMTVDEFNRRMAAGRMGHVGLAESAAMVFDSLGRKLVRFDSRVEPIISDRPITTDHVDVRPGQVKGLRQLACAHAEAGEFLALTFVAALELADEGDLVQITGKPNLEVRLKGTNGDIGTVAIVVNAIPRVLQAPPGLVTMRDLPIVTA